MSRAAVAPPRALLYLHGFRSSPQSFKARRLAAWCARHAPALGFHAPQLPPSPAQALAACERWLAGRAPAEVAVVGSSLGGFYAAVLAARHGCRAVLMNPAVRPARDLRGAVGELTAYHDATRRFVFEPGYLDELAALEAEWPAGHTPRAPWLAIIASGDEVLDAAEMRAHCAGCTLLAIDGGDHALSDFDAAEQALLGFLGLAAPPG